MNKTTNKYSPEVRERAVRMVLDNQGQHEISCRHCSEICPNPPTHTITQ